MFLVLAHSSPFQCYWVNRTVFVFCNPSHLSFGVDETFDSYRYKENHYLISHHLEERQNKNAIFDDVIVLNVKKVRGTFLDKTERSFKLLGLSPDTRYLICVLGLGNWEQVISDSRISHTNQTADPLLLLSDSQTSRCTEVSTFIGCNNLSYSSDLKWNYKNIIICETVAMNLMKFISFLNNSYYYKWYIYRAMDSLTGQKFQVTVSLYNNKRVYASETMIIFLI